MTRNVVWRHPQKSAIQIYVSIKYRECRYVVILMVARNGEYAVW